jgi:predicted nucleic acid-binding protein
MSVLVDSSVWIAASKKGSKVAPRLAKMIHSDEIIYYSKIIQVEVSQGARTQGEFASVWDAFLGFNELPVLDSDWEAAAWNYYRCRGKGVTLSTVDCLIATLAARYRLPLWSEDKVFLKIAPIIGFDLVV